MEPTLPEFDFECFFIGPIGQDGSGERERSDGVFEFIVSPAASAVGLTAVRADRIAVPGEITRQTLEHAIQAKAAVVDLTGGNPNAYYEMAVRHTLRLPTVLIAEVGEVLPFDIRQMRTIFFDHRSLKSASECCTAVQAHLSEAMAGSIDSPVSATINLSKLAAGNALERTMANLVGLTEDISREIKQLDVKTATAISLVIQGFLDEASVERQFGRSTGNDPSLPAFSPPPPRSDNPSSPEE